MTPELEMYAIPGSGLVFFCYLLLGCMVGIFIGLGIGHWLADPKNKADLDTN